MAASGLQALRYQFIGRCVRLCAVLIDSYFEQIKPILHETNCSVCLHLKRTSLTGGPLGNSRSSLLKDKIFRVPSPVNSTLMKSLACLQKILAQNKMKLK